MHTFLRVRHGVGMRDEPLRTFAWEAMVSIVDHSVHHEIELT